MTSKHASTYRCNCLLYNNLSSLIYSNTMFACLLPISSGTAGPIWLNFFLLAPSWSRDGFRPKKIRIQDPEIRKNPDFRLLFDPFGWNSQVILTLTQICLTQINFWIWYPVFRIQNPVFPEIQKNLDFRVFFDQFGWNLQVILTLTQICFNTNKFLDQVSGFPDPESGFSRKNPAKLGKNQV